MTNIASPLKIACHPKKLGTFLQGEHVYPISIELDITTACSYQCAHCPSVMRPSIGCLPIDKVEKLFACVAGQTRGLLLSGGEPTMASTLPDVLRLARAHGFEDVAIVSNGSRLADERVVSALLADASAIRVSLYGWEEEGPGAQLQEVLEKIEALRFRVENENSPLEIGFSVLTSSAMVPDLSRIIRTVHDAGAHWIYFHPMCKGWGAAQLSQFDQHGVQQEIEACAQSLDNGFEVMLCPDRYNVTEIQFDEYYTAHFLLVVGADGCNYLGTEVKYQPDYVIADLSQDWDDKFLWRQSRLARIRKADSRTYPSVGGRHRGILYSDLLQKLKTGQEDLVDVVRRACDADLRYPHVL